MTGSVAIKPVPDESLHVPVEVIEPLITLSSTPTIAINVHPRASVTATSLVVPTMT